MTDTNLLRKYIEEKGYKLKYVAAYLGLSGYGLSLKLNNVNEFKTSEINKLCKLLGIQSLRDKEAIFFKEKDD